MKRLPAAIVLGLLLPFSALADFGTQVIIDGKTVVFGDVPQSAWYSTYVRSAAEAGIVSGYRDGNGNLTGQFKPGSKITIAEALKIAVESANYDSAAYATRVDSGVNHWASPYVSVAKAEGFPVITAGMSLDRNATRAEVAALITAAFRKSVEEVELGSRFTDVNSSIEFSSSIEVLSRDGIVSGDTDIEGQATGTFRPKDAIIRAEVAKIAMEARTSYGTPGTDRVPEETDSDLDGDMTVSYTDDGFSPSVLRVKVGSTVTFKNDSGESMWVASNPHPVHTDLEGLDAQQSIAPGGTYSFLFTRLGTWSYHNHLSATHEATIIVEE